MNIELTPRRFVGGLGWFAAWAFWGLLAFVLMSLLSSSDRSGAGMVIFFGLTFMGMTFPLLIIPLGILIYGVRKDHALPLPRTLFKWGTISAVIYLASLVVAFLFMQ